MYRLNDDKLQVFLVHPGGPYYRKKDEGYWSVPKGEPGEGEGEQFLFNTAKREFKEETGIEPDADEFTDLGDIIQKGGKKVFCWAFRTDIMDEPVIKSNHFTIEWPPGKGKFAEFPEADDGRFFTIEEARKRIKKTQEAFLDRLIIHVSKQDE
jgi:predicted NUDIX family NTP pyrophosphohydrolase